MATARRSRNGRRGQQRERARTRAREAAVLQKLGETLGFREAAIFLGKTSLSRKAAVFGETLFLGETAAVFGETADFSGETKLFGQTSLFRQAAFCRQTAIFYGQATSLTEGGRGLLVLRRQPDHPRVS